MFSLCFPCFLGFGERDSFETDTVLLNEAINYISRSDDYSLRLALLHLSAAAEKGAGLLRWPVSLLWVQLGATAPSSGRAGGAVQTVGSAHPFTQHPLGPSDVYTWELRLG